MKRVLKYYLRNLIPAIIILILVGLLFEYLLTEYSKKQNTENNSHIIDLEFRNLSKLLQEPLADLFFISNRRNVSTEDYIIFLKSDFFVFSQSREYYQIRLLDTLGNEMVRVDYKDGNHVIIPDSLLQDKSHRYYFKESRKLQKDQVYISKLDLNQENGQVVSPLEFVIRLVSPIYENNLKVGYTIINVNMNDFIENLVQGVELKKKLLVFNQDSINMSVMACPECTYYETTAETPIFDELTERYTRKALDFRKVVEDFNQHHKTNIALHNKGWISLVADNKIDKEKIWIYRVIIYSILTIILLSFYSFLVTVRVQTTDHKLNRSMKEVLKNEQLLSIKNSQLESFVRIASHDLREPLATIKSTTKSLLDYENKKTDKIFPKYIDFIVRCVDRMDGLTKGILDYAITGKSSNIIRIDMNKLVHEIKLDLHSTIKEKKAKIKHGHLPTISAYPLELKQVFQNLISNSIKYCRNDVPPVIKIEYIETAEFHSFHIIDNGIGISESDRESIFEMFSRLEKKPEEDGLGIGLAITQKLVMLHLGSISIDSNDLGGSTFTFTISKSLDSVV
ncbi:MAG: hypothetical protein CMB80_17995 [Flammeovirgaceae bacterium]|nr:hypothetical protein [Flammeovirgaceae bacterium]MBR06730.1 hypothetical protein [Rickettsiales bacterium]|tara:strand:+ start:487 stop:2184 length:1698 start_codon:yes stop_codon:yes gene_type:complete